MASFRKILSNRVLLTAVSILMLLIVLIVLGIIMKPREEPLQGQVETTDYRISSKVPSRVVRFYVREGQTVHRGDTVVVLTSPEVNAAKRERQAHEEAQSALSNMTEEGTRKELIRSSREVWAQAQANRVIAEKTYRRMSNLQREGVITTQRMDESRAAYESALAAEQAAKSNYDLAVNGSRRQQIDASRALVQKARAQIEEVDALYQETVLTAPADGRVTEIFPEVGELVGTGAPIMNIETDDVWFTFNLREDKLPGIEVGQVVTCYIPATDVTVQARVSLMKNVGDFVAWKATRALDDMDLKVFEVQARPLRPVSHVKEGMSVTLKK